jgi:DNA-binding CsgD family transcriptional regulator/tetratricopeptide (TPR) repeat protein
MREPPEHGTIALVNMGPTLEQKVAPFEAAIVCPTTIGREPQLARLSRLVDQLVDGHGNTVVLTGEAGIGKTRLVAATRTVALGRNLRVLQGSAFELDRAVPYGPITDLLRAYLSARSPQEALEELGPAMVPLARLLPMVAAWLPQESHQSLTTDEKQATLQGLLLAFDRLVQHGPTMIVIEDVHWADEASLDLLLHLVRSARARALLVLLTLRAEDAGPSVVDFRATLERQRLMIEVPLSPLNRADTETMIQCIVGAPVRTDLLEMILGLTEGNPFFVEETLQSAITAGDARVQLGAMRVPRTVHDSVQRRVNGLGEPARRVVQIAAVAGRRFDFALLQMLLGIDERELLSILKELIRAQLVVEETDERFAFRHALTRQAIYADLLGRERRALHAEVFAALEQLTRQAVEVSYEELSYHAHAAAAWAKTVGYGSAAGERALLMHAPRAAVEHFARVVDAAEKLGQSPGPAVLRGRGQAYHSLGQFELARADHQTALELALATDDKRLAWQLLVDLNLLWSARDYSVAGEYAERSLAAARELDDRGCVARSLDRLGNWHLNIGRVRQALEYQQQALELLESLGDRRGVADTLNLLGMTSAFVDSEQSAAYYGRAIPLMREFDDRQGLVTDLVMRAIESGFYYGDTFAPARLDAIQSERDVQEAVALARAIDWPAGESFARWELALWYGMRGHYARGFELASSGLRIAEEIEHKEWIAAGLCSLGALYVDVFAPERAWPMLERALALARELGSSVWVPYAAARLALAYTLERDFSKAAAILEAELGADSAAESATERQLWSARAELLLARGAPSEALVIIENLAARLRAGNVAPRLWILRGNALTALRAFDDAEQFLVQAVDVCRASDLRSQEWRAHAAYARLLRRLGRRDEADREIHLARASVQELAAEITDQSLRTAFVERALERVPHGGLASERRLRKQAFGGLTAREREVAALIGQGLSNRAIAGRLVVSERTVESYVSSILGKLGFNARTQIAAWAVTTGVR